ncbi:MAG: hypothetical protein ACQEQO_00510 [Thermodesulfobacteriota bacterium]
MWQYTGVWPPIQTGCVLVTNRENGGTIMPDFYQEGVVTTLHALYEAFEREKYLTDLEGKLDELRYFYG